MQDAQDDTVAQRQALLASVEKSEAELKRACATITAKEREFELLAKDLASAKSEAVACRNQSKMLSEKLSDERVAFAKYKREAGVSLFCLMRCM